MENTFVSRTLILTFSIVFAKLIEFFSKTYISNFLGKEGIGFYQLILTFYSIIIMFSTFGLPITASKMISEKLGTKKFKEARKISNIAILFNFILSLFFILIIRANIDFIVEKIPFGSNIKQGFINILPSVLFASVSSVIKGYFLAYRNTIFPAAAEILEQIVKISIIGLLIKNNQHRNHSFLNGMIFLGYTLGEISSHIFLLSCYYFHKKHINKKEKLICSSNNFKNILNPKLEKLGISRTLIKNSFPLGAASLFEAFFHFLEDILIIWGFKKFGFDDSKAVSKFGIIDGMATTLLAFPLVLLTPLVTVITPEIARCRENKIRVSHIISKSHEIIINFGFFITGLFYVLSNELSMILYKENEVGKVLKILCFTFPFISLNLISTAALNGLNGQSILLRWSVGLSIFRVLLLFLLVPVFGIPGLFIVFIFDEVFSCLSNIIQLKSFISFSIKVKNTILKPLFFAIITSYICMTFKNLYCLTFFWKIIFTFLIFSFIYSFQFINIKRKIF